MTDLLFYGDTERSAAMRHELPVAIMDPFLLAVVGGRTHVAGNTVAIVVGSSSHAAHRAVGSVAVSLARHSPVPLVIVP